jgi:hypothetical protein
MLTGDELEVFLQSDPEVDMMSFVNALTYGDGAISLQDTPALLGSKYGENRSWFADIFLDKDLTRRDQKLKKLIDQGYNFDDYHDNPDGVVPWTKSEWMEQVTKELEEVFELGQFADTGPKTDGAVQKDGALSAIHRAPRGAPPEPPPASPIVNVEDQPQSAQNLVEVNGRMVQNATAQKFV